jgi:glycyl-tRNA synthetase beta subunit
VSLPFLLEIGTEEIPDWMIVPALNNLQDMFQALLDQHALGGKVDSRGCHAAPPGAARVRIAGAAGRCAKSWSWVPRNRLERERRPGSRRKWARRPTSWDETTAKGEYFSFTKRTQGPSHARSAGARAGPIILKIHWPKTMYWNGKGSASVLSGPFAGSSRCSAGDRAVPFEIAGCTAGNTPRDTECSAAVNSGHQRKF